MERKFLGYEKSWNKLEYPNEGSGKLIEDYIIAGLEFVASFTSGVMEIDAIFIKDNGRRSVVDVRIYRKSYGYYVWFTGDIYVKGIERRDLPTYEEVLGYLGNSEIMWIKVTNGMIGKKWTFIEAN
jgi:hypothetical protein